MAGKDHPYKNLAGNGHLYGGNGYQPIPANQMLRKLMLGKQPMGSSPWNLLGQLNAERNPICGNSKDYGMSNLVRKNKKIMELEKMLEEEEWKIAKNERDKAKLKKQHEIADQKINDLRLQVENAKNKNRNENKNKNNNNNFGHGNIMIGRLDWIGRKN